MLYTRLRYLKVENEGPNETKDEVDIAIHYINGTDILWVYIHLLHLIQGFANILQRVNAHCSARQCDLPSSITCQAFMFSQKRLFNLKEAKLHKNAVEPTSAIKSDVD